MQVGFCSSGKNNACVRRSQRGTAERVWLCSGSRAHSPARSGEGLGYLCPVVGPSAGSTDAPQGIRPFSVFAGAAGFSLGSKIGLTTTLGPLGAAAGAKLFKGKTTPGDNRK